MTHKELEDYRPGIGLLECARLINPLNVPLRVYYPGSGGDIRTPLIASNSDTFVHVDEVALRGSYYGDKTTWDRMKGEIKAAGGSNLVVDESLDGVAQIEFDYQHRHDPRPRHRSIRFHAQDSFQFWPPEYTSGYDVLFLFGESPTFTGHDVEHRLYTNLAVGGSVVTDRSLTRYIPSEWVGFKEILQVGDHISPIRVYHHDHQPDSTLLSSLLHFQDAFDDLDGFVRGGNPYTANRDISFDVMMSVFGETKAKSIWPEWQTSLDLQKAEYVLELANKVRQAVDIIETLPPEMRVELPKRLAAKWGLTRERVGEFIPGEDARRLFSD